MEPKAKTKKQTTPKGKGKKNVTEEISNVDGVLEVVPEVTHPATEVIPKSTKDVAEDIPTTQQINHNLTLLVYTYFKIVEFHSEF